MIRRSNAVRRSDAGTVSQKIMPFLRRGLAVGVLATLAACAVTPQSPTVSPLNGLVVKEGLSRPESAYRWKDFIYISNQDGPGMLKDGSGWISKLDLNGRMLQARWVDGLNAPKGLRAWNNLLLTADIDQLIIVDTETGKIRQKLDIPGARLLNDIAITEDGIAFISDTVQGVIYRVSNLGDAHPKVSVWIKDLKQAPNGLYLYGPHLYVAGWGTEIGEGFKTKTPGVLYRIGLADQAIETLSAPLGHLDGLERLRDGRWVFTALWEDTVYLYDPVQREVSTLYHTDKNDPQSDKRATNPADIGVLDDQRILMIPNSSLNQVTFTAY